MKIGIYKHYKGKMYEVIGIANHSENLEQLVIYKALYEDKEFPLHQLWARPLKMFEEEIEINGEKIKRFTFLSKK